MNQSALKLLLYAYSTSTFSVGALAPVYAFFIQELGGGILETAWSMALFSIVTGLITIVVYKIPASHTYRRELLSLGWFLWLISTLMYCCMNSLSILYLSQLLGALGSALSGATFDAEYSEMAGDNVLDAWAMYEGVTSITTGIASILAGIIAHYFGLGVLMICMSGIGMVSFVMVFHYMYMRNSEEKALLGKVKG